jgi:menaquinone-dependent protoporphyrinogen oxidase
MKQYLILFSTTDGHTFDICNRIKKVIEKQDNIQVDLGLLPDNMDIDINKYDKVILGASIRYGKHNPEVYTFIENHLSDLEKIDNAFFSVNVVARKPEKNTPETNPYMVKFLNQIDWKPKKLAVFGGRLEYPKYSFWDRTMIRLIMWMTKGPTARNTIIEYTDWEKVDVFAKELSSRPDFVA